MGQRQEILDKWNAMSEKEQAREGYNNPLVAYGTTCYCTGGHFPLANCPYALFEDEIKFTDSKGHTSLLFEDG